MINRLIATVAVEKTFFNFDSDYDYYVPEELKSAVSIGTRVKVPFGKGNVLRYGIVVKLFEAINGGLKEISSVSSKTPVLSDEMVALALWLKERCFCTTYECLKQMLPRGIDKVGDKSTRMIRLLYENEESLPKLTPKQKAVVNLLFDVGAASVHEVCEFCSVGEGVVKNLVKYGVCEIYDKEIYRMPYNVYKESRYKTEIELSEQQGSAYAMYSEMLENGGGTGLLYGVTGSGKTQVYLKLIDKVLSMGKDVIVMMNISVRTGEKQVLLSEQEVLFLHLFIIWGLLLWMKSRSILIKVNARLDIMQNRLRISDVNIIKLCCCLPRQHRALKAIQPH